MSVNLQDSLHPKLSVVVNNKKFLWDGRFYELFEEAYRQAETYKDDNFEVHLLEQDNQHLLYTRRVVKEVA